MEFQYGNLQNPVKKLHIPYANGFFYTTPITAPGRIMADDFIYFFWGNGTHRPKQI